MLKGRQKRWRVVAFMTVALVVAALLSFSSSAWATPGQTHAQAETVKRPDVDCCEPGEPFVFEITFFAEGADWHNVVVTDKLHPFLKIGGVWTSHGTASYVGQVVTVDVGDITKDTIVIIRITCTVQDGAPPCFRIYNTASVVVEDPDMKFDVPDPLKDDDPIYIEVCGCDFVPEPSSLLLLGSGLAGLAGYAGLRWSRYGR